MSPLHVGSACWVLKSEAAASVPPRSSGLSWCGPCPCRRAVSFGPSIAMAVTPDARVVCHFWHHPCAPRHCRHIGALRQCSSTCVKAAPLLLCPHVSVAPLFPLVAIESDKCTMCIASLSDAPPLSDHHLFCDVNAEPIVFSDVSYAVCRSQN